MNRGVRNPVVLTGDVHRHWANNVKLNYFDTAAAPVGAELVASSITSGGDGADSTPGGMQYNPHLNYIGNHRGYVRVTANATQLVADFQKVSSVVTRDPASVTLSTVRKYALEDGVPGLHQV